MINNFQKTRDRMKKLCALLHMKFFSQQDDTQIINFYEGVWNLWPFFWGNIIFKICPDISKVTNSSLPQTLLLIQKEQFLKMTLPQKNGSRIKTPSSKLLILVLFCWEKNVLLINALTNLIQSLISLKLLIVGVAFFLGHPVYLLAMHLLLGMWLFYAEWRVVL